MHKKYKKVTQKHTLQLLAVGFGILYIMGLLPPISQLSDPNLVGNGLHEILPGIKLGCMTLAGLLLVLAIKDLLLSSSVYRSSDQQLKSSVSRW